MKFLETSKQLTINEIETVEKELDVKFPPEFTIHYLQYNGGYTPDNEYVWPNGSHTSINCFFSMKYEGFVSLETSYSNLVILEDYLPAGIIPFASDDGGNDFCISSRTQDFGTIYYCNHDHYNTENKEEFLTFVDKTFDDFIAKFQKKTL